MEVSPSLSHQIQIDGKTIGPGQPVYVIAEAGVSHFGSYEKAIQLVDLAAQAHADCVKFQIFDVDDLFSDEAAKWKQRLSTRCLGKKDFFRIRDYCATKGITFLATAHDDFGLSVLDELKVAAFKIGSGELRNWQFLKKISAKQKPIIYSTGMHSLQDIHDSIGVMVAEGNSDIAILHCVTQYPTPPELVNLEFIKTLRDNFSGVIGYSDHTAGYHISLAAVALGASIVEKHITLEYDIPSAQDWKVSCGPDNLAKFVADLRDIENAMGSRNKVIAASENRNIEWARKSIVLIRNLSSGHKLVKEDFVFRRPGTGIAPSDLENILGKTVKCDLAKNTLLKLDDIQ